MKEHAALKEAIDRAKKGELEGFENLYILTYQDVYTELLSISNDEDSAKKLLEDTYIAVYRDIEAAPQGEQIVRWIYDKAYSRAEQENEIVPETGLVGKLPEEKAATILLDIEERIGVNEAEEKTDKQTVFYYISAKIVAACITVVLAIVAVVFGIKQFSIYIDEVNHVEAMASSLESRQAVSPTEDVSVEVTSEQGDMINLAGQNIYISENGQIIDVISGKSEHYNSEIQELGEWTYYLKRDYFQGSDELSNEDPALFGKLFRISEKNRDNYEIISEDVQDYVIYNDKIYYMQADTICEADPGEEFVKKPFTYHVMAQNDGLYLMDIIGLPAVCDQDGTVKIDDRIYSVDSESGKIKYVKQAPQESNGITYYLTDLDGNVGNELCWKNSSQSGILVNVGKWIDSFCIVDNWIYFSAYVEKDDKGMMYSRIYRCSLDGTKVEEIHGSYPGSLGMMYYYPERKEIFAEYFPDSANSYFGRIAVISPEGQMSYIKDSEYRIGQETTGNDMLEMVMATEDLIYTLWHDCNWRKGGEVSIRWSKPLVLSNKERIYIESQTVGNPAG